MQHALAILASVLADPASPAAAAALADLRARWGDLAQDERDALTPLARLAAERVEAASRPAADPDEEAYLAYLASMEATVAAEAQGPAAPPAPDARPAERRPAAGPRAPDARSADRRPTAAPPAPDAGPAERRHAASLPAQDRGAVDRRDAAPTLFAPDPPPRTAAARRPLTDVTPEGLLGLLGLSTFRPGQREAVQAALDGRDALVVMPTGGGKSLCYQLPALAGDDLTVVVSPLIALMRDQCARLTDLGHPAVMLASGGDGESNRSALQDVRDGRAAVCFAAPERFASAAFRSALSRRALALFVVDEAHCVSEWGHDFRPDYLRLASVIAELGHPPVMACTATATPKVAEEIVARLGLREPARVRSGFDRPNLSFDVLPFDGEGSVARKRATLVAGLGMDDNRPA
ncbi:MAG: ATP-dependent helicase RecQ, partial [Solirubrobacteraceae bacterium]|nr:ATP-dependent helicase RecQ [Solirubrobacteraceae bacterium]